MTDEQREEVRRLYQEEEWCSQNSHPWEGPMDHYYRAVGEVARRLGLTTNEVQEVVPSA